MTTSTKKWQVMSSHHRSKCCGPCILCNRMQPRYDHFCTLTNSEQGFLQQHFESEIARSSCLCRSHVVEAKRHRSDPEYVPTWKKSGPKSKSSMCMYPGCDVASSPLGERIIIPSRDNLPAFAEVLNIEGDISLCETHYQAIYRRLHKPDPCAGCGAKPKAREGAYTRHSLDAIAVSQYLCTGGGSDPCLSPNDTLCKGCYDLHCVIMNHLQQQTNQSAARLKSDILLWKDKLSDENTDALTRAILSTVIFVAHKLQEDRALLLPQAVTVFMDNYPYSSSEELHLELEYGRVKFSPRWLLHQLIIYLQPFMTFKCIIKRIGTLLYPRNSDPLICLSLALHDAQTNSLPKFVASTEKPSSSESVLREASDIISDMIHTEIKRQKEESIDLTIFNLQKSIDKTNTQLWDFINRCTRSVRGRTSRANCDNSHTKTVRKYFIICMMLFATDPACASTLHHLVADTVEVNGGSRNLIRFFNKIGVSVSNDTHDRLVTDVAEKKKATPLWSELSPNIFTYASTDNIDFLQSHAAVYCGDQTRSYHATTIQIVQPVPSLQLSSSSDANTPLQSQSSSMPSQPSSSSSTTETQLQSQPSSTPPCSPGPHPEKTQMQSKRLLSNSPSNSPHALGKVGPKRRRTVQVSPKKVVPQTRHPQQMSSTGNITPRKNLNLEKFSELEQEKDSRMKLYKEVFGYFFQKLTIQESDSTKTLKPLREFLLPTPAQLKDSDPSVLYYMELIDENADSQETMAEVSEMVFEKLLSEKQKWVVIVGDGKTYEHLQRIKRLYGSAFEQLLLFPGDWHTLKNFQPVLMKAYYHAGLKQIAKNSGYKAETLTSLENCSHFKRTHSFLLQVWEAMFTEMICAFVSCNPQYSSLQNSLLEEFNRATHDDTNCHDMLLTVQRLATQVMALDEFNKFVEKQAEVDSTWQLWSNFVLRDCFSYVCLFLAIRTSNWDLRVASLKGMAPLFAAYDRPCYQKIIPNHIADIQCYPKEILACFEAGGFTVKVKGGLGHAVALDEAHEMCVNRDLKMAIARPTLAYLKKTNFFFSYRIKAQTQVTAQLFPTKETQTRKPHLLDATATTKCWNDNVVNMRSLISQQELFPHVQCNRGVMNMFTGVKATAEQAHDLLNARKVGEQHYKNYITHHILERPSTDDAPLRKSRLLTMAPPKTTKTKISQREKEERNTNKYLRRRLAWCNRTGQKFDEGEEQYSILPRAFADPDGNPHKGAKSKWTDKLKARYNAPTTTPFGPVPPWVPEVVIVDAMFPLNITPLRQHKTITDYAYLLFRASIIPHFVRGTSEVHFVFDYPERLDFNPKDCEHNRRYGKSQNEHIHLSLTPQSAIPRPWKEHLQCKQCKRAIVEALGWSYLRTAKANLRDGQVLVLGGCFSGQSQDDAWIITGGGATPPQSSARYRSNAQEADMRVWRHAIQSEHERIMICSADTDVYNIGLVMARPNKHYVVQINPPHAANAIYLDIDKLMLSLERDPDLASLPQNQLGSIMLQLYIVTGCDYISYISGIGKATILKVFFQHAEFIAGEQSAGSLSQTETSTLNTGFYSCIRLIGTAYFKKNLATMVSKIGFETPNQLFNSISPEMTIEDRHKEWYMCIKRAIHIISEDQRPPTLTSLWRHWTRSCWIKQMWRNSSESDQYNGLALPETQGWLTDANGYSIDWEAAETTQKIKATLDFLDKGCMCKTGCKTKRCSCQKKGRECGAGCECKGCTNITVSHPDEQSHSNEDDDEEENEDDGAESDVSESDDSDDELETEIITDTFAYEDDQMAI